jgi:hypothetical protein
VTKNRLFVAVIITALLLAAPMALAAKPKPGILEVTPTRQTISLPDDPTAIYSLILRNTADVPQEFEIFSYTPRYFGDPGFIHHFEVDGEVVPMVFYLTLDPGEEVPFILVVDAYHSDTEVPEYWCAVHAVGPVNTAFVDTYTIRTGSKGGGKVF